MRMSSVLHRSYRRSHRECGLTPRHWPIGVLGTKRSIGSSNFGSLLIVRINHRDCNVGAPAWFAETEWGRVLPDANDLLTAPTVAPFGQ